MAHAASRPYMKGGSRFLPRDMTNDSISEERIRKALNIDPLKRKMRQTGEFAGAYITKENGDGSAT